ncbi:MAG: hypothetical protein M3082_01135 [Candidatus Dormibacteraeota bacterium]|nr:hypothetical protein [Candidatus Dormibacteraeota bacterium]
MKTSKVQPSGVRIPLPPPHPEYESNEDIVVLLGNVNARTYVLTATVTAAAMDATDSELERVTKQQLANLYASLLTAARNGGRVFYSDIEGIVGLDHHKAQDRNVLGGLLPVISRAEVAQGRPMLSSVVWRKDTNRIGPGFFPLAQQLGRIRSGRDEKCL